MPPRRWPPNLLRCVGCKTALPARAAPMEPAEMPLCADCRAIIFAAIERAPLIEVPLDGEPRRDH